MKSFSKNFLTGLAAILPITLTLYLLYWFVYSAESFLGRIFRWFLPAHWYLPGLGMLAGILLIFVMGTLMQALLIQKLFSWAEKLFIRVPLFKTIYSSIRDLIGYIARDQNAAQQQVVMITLGDTDMKLIGFTTRSELPPFSETAGIAERIAVYLPMSYQIGGYTVLVPKSAVEPLDMSLDEAMRFVLTAGIVDSRAENGKHFNTTKKS
ncbi:MAG: DUF502 domain-containing protein [Desulfobacterales bacterium]|nr:DUF502 domain-containing protein [Desulfobacterales bacterium]